MKLTKDEQKLILKVAKGYLLAKELVGLPTGAVKAAQQLVLAAEAAELDVPGVPCPFCQAEGKSGMCYLHSGA